jgi:hypothetical protein
LGKVCPFAEVKRLRKFSPPLHTSPLLLPVLPEKERSQLYVVCIEIFRKAAEKPLFVFQNERRQKLWFISLMRT